MWVLPTLCTYVFSNQTASKHHTWHKRYSKPLHEVLSVCSVISDHLTAHSLLLAEKEGQGNCNGWRCCNRSFHSAGVANEHGSQHRMRWLCPVNTKQTAEQHQLIIDGKWHSKSTVPCPHATEPLDAPKSSLRLRVHQSMEGFNVHSEPLMRSGFIVLCWKSTLVKHYPSQ